MFNINLKAERNNTPFDWINIVDLFNDEDKKNFVETYPTDNYRTISKNAEDRQYYYDVRALVNFKGKVENKGSLSDSWITLSDYITSEAYRHFIYKVSNIDVSGLPCEVNVYKYAKNAFMDAHQDLNTKVLTQVIYFNDKWDEKDGGYLNILTSKSTKDVHKKILPEIGNSVIIIRSENSWHSVEPTTCDKSRRSVTITFYKKDSSSPMWLGQKYQLHNNFD